MASAIVQLYAEYVCAKKRKYPDGVPAQIRAEVLAVCKKECPKEVTDV